MFTGREYDSETGNYYYRARYYKPSIGRFISRDPILSPVQTVDNFFWPLPYLVGNPQMMNSYVYCVNNPVTHIDPEGLAAPITIGILIGILIVTTILTIGCLRRVGKALEKINARRKNEKNDEGCNTQARWNNFLNDIKEVIRACGTPNYVG